MSEVKLYQGDCLEVMKDIPDKSIDMILCDLPYGTTQNSWDCIIDVNDLWIEYNRVIKDNGAIALFSQEPFTSQLVMSNPKMFRYDIIWEKTKAGGFLNANRMPLRAHENILIFYKKLPKYFPQKEEGKPYIKKAITDGDGGCYGKFSRAGTTNVNEGSRYPRSVIKFSNPNNNSLHKTQKPVELLEWLIKTYTNEGEAVLDNCMGSGSTGVACLNINRNFIGIELDPTYFQIAKNRIEQAQSEKE